MVLDLAASFRPVAPPQLIDDAYTADQHARLLNVVRTHGPWKLIMADMRRRGIAFEVPTDPMNDREFVRLVATVYDIGTPRNIPPDAMDEAA